ncbi:ABC transporter permease [Candidatus Woesearchaeota archaeon]|jgi:ABC-type multidrug transport system permease subunit|nr:ABC transporter permease [Candidatus Woesearchaeota archaeon]
MASKFLASLVKDFKILFRDFTSVFLVVVGPLAVMLVLLLAFSNIGFTDITIGYTNPGGTEYQEFIPKLSYIGNFVEYDSIGACQQDLKYQNNYLCLEPRDSTLVVHFDNTRELISLILINQVRSAATFEKENLQKAQAKSFLSEISKAERYMDEGDRFAGELLNDLSGQRGELIDTSRDLGDIENDISGRIDDLNSVRSVVIPLEQSISNSAEREIAEARQLIVDSSDALLLAANDLDSAGGDGSYLRSLAFTLSDNGNGLYALEQNILTSLTTFPLLINELNTAINQLENAREFVGSSQNRIDRGVDLLDQRSQEIRELQQELREKQRELKEIGKMSEEDIVNPFLLDYQPLFTVSERLKAKTLDVDLTDEEKKRLVNFGAIQTFLPLIMVLLICFISTILANILTLNELHSKAFLRNQILPMSWLTRFFSKFSTVLVVTVIQALIILFIGYVVFFLDIFGSFWIILLVLVLLVGTYSLIGIAVAYFVNSKTTSLLFCSFFLIINILLGGIIYPIERMAPFMTYVAEAVPFQSGVSMLQQSIFYHVPFSLMWQQLLQMVSLLLVSFIVVVIARKYYLNRYARGK